MICFTASIDESLGWFRLIALEDFPGGRSIYFEARSIALRLSIWFRSLVSSLIPLPGSPHRCQLVLGSKDASDRKSDLEPQVRKFVRKCGVYFMFRMHARILGYALHEITESLFKVSYIHPNHHRDA